MKNLRNWAFALAVTIFVAGAAALEAQGTGWLSMSTNESSGAVQARNLNIYGAPIMVGRGTAVPTVANSGAPPMDGEFYVVVADSTAPDIQFYDNNASAWYTVASTDFAQTFAGAQTFSGALTFNAASTLGEDGDDDVTIIGPVVRDSTFREDFDSVLWTGSFETADGTAALTTNGGVNTIVLDSYDGDNLGYIGYHVDGDNLGGTPSPLATDGVFTVAGFVDDADDEGIVFTFGAHNSASTSTWLQPSTGATFTNGTDSQMYCETQIDIATINRTDDLWFGWVLNDAVDTNPASADYDTAALFTLVDDTGDLHAVTMIDNGAETNDDTNVDWTDGDQFILRVAIGDDAVVFSAELDDAGSTVDVLTTTTAVLDGTATDVMKCVLGYTADATAGGDVGVTLNYVEIGLE